jgi:hypothetical protein
MMPEHGAASVEWPSGLDLQGQIRILICLYALIQDQFPHRVYEEFASEQRY